MARRSPWGSVRRLPSGRFQARYRVDGVVYVAADTFRTKGDADAYLARVRSDLARGAWVDPDAGRTTLADYSSRWLKERPVRPRTRELYAGQLRWHILPTLGDVELAKITPARVRSWHAELLAKGTIGPVTVAKCYRLLRTILGTAVEDELIVKNPCVLKTAGVEHSPERPTVTIEQVYWLADQIEPSLRALVLLAAFCGLRLGELLALTRARVDLLHGTVTVREQLQELASGKQIVGPPKSAAGVRTVAIPEAIVADLEAHLARWARRGAGGHLFCNSDGQPLPRAVVHRAWRRAARAVGVPDLRLHDLRHTGNTLAAATGASTKELMARMGHASPRAALIYQHATRDRDAAIADALSAMISARPTREGGQVHRLQSAPGASRGHKGAK